MRTSRTAGTAVALLLAVALGGCFLLPAQHDAQPAATAEAQTEADNRAVDVAPEVGDCWSETYDNYHSWDFWRGDAPVRCGHRHQAYTFAVTEALANADEIYLANGFLDGEVRDMVVERCADQLAKFLGGPIAEWSRMESSPFVPTKQQWRDGERWLRCDLTIVGVGSSLFDPEFADLPESTGVLVDQLDKNADRFDVCVDTEDGWSGWGPYESESSIYSICSDDPMWRLHRYELYPGEQGATFPGDEAMEQFVADRCFADLPASQPAYAYWPDSNTWANGDRALSCWTYEWNDAPDMTGPPL